VPERQQRSVVQSIVELVEDLVTAPVPLEPAVRAGLSDRIVDLLHQAGVQDLGDWADPSTMPLASEDEIAEGPVETGEHRVLPEDVEQYRSLGAPDWLLARLTALTVPERSEACC
jgi:hypothetical protein